jgi:uncharacterized protein involved in outer membrane biogenesis
VLRLLRRILLIVGLGLAGLVLAFIVVVSLGIRVDLDRFRKPFETVASTSLGRTVKLEGDVFLVPTWSVTVEAQGLRIANPAGWQERELAHMELARIRIDAVPLLWRRLVIRELRAEGVQAILERRADGSANWDFARGAEPGSNAAEEPEATTAAGTEEEPAWHALLPNAVVVKDLTFLDIRAEFRDAVAGVERTLVLEEFRGAAASDAPLELGLRGRYDGEELRVKLQGGDPSVLIGSEEAFPLRLELEIADTRFELSAQVDEGEWDITDALDLFLATAASPVAGIEDQRLGEVKVVLEGERLDALDRILEVSLPPWGPHRFEARFEAFGGGDLTADVVSRIGSSELTGRLVVESQAEPPRLELALKASEIQLDDYRVGDWTLLEEEPGEAPPEADGESRPAPRALLSPEVMKRFDAKLELDVGRVAAGRDWLGKGRLAARLEKGAFRLDAFDVDVRGGSIATRASLTPRRRGVSGTVNLRIDRFDYGVLARRFAPDSDMKGLFGVEVELASTAPRAVDLLKNASGHFDFAVFPETLEAGVIDLWAVNLVSAVLPVIDEDQSKVNCLVALMDMEQGIMRQQVLIVDTSRLTVHGEAKIDFHTERIEVDLAPTPKRPQFFSAATPIHVEGNFEDFGIGVDAGDVLGTLIRFMTSVIHVPVQRLFTPDRDPDELETCMAALKSR